jgi:hypothetical protein
MDNVVRPRVQIARPKVLSKAFNDPNAVVDLLRRGVPYKTQEASHRHVGVERTSGWFRNFWALGGKVLLDEAAPLFENEIFIQAAKQSFQAESVRPVAMMTNFNLPMAGLPPHLDLPFFRGAMNREVPAWMLAPMGYSGLFHDWAVPVASAVTWFYEGDGGEFEYWPDGLKAPSKTMTAPFYNRAVLADNEYMYHRVGSLGKEADWVPQDGVPYGALLYLEDDRWIVRDDERDLHVYPWGSVRLSVLWKAYCFRTPQEESLFDGRSNDLTPDMVTEIFADDLAEKGVRFAIPKDIFKDVEWKEVLEAAYPAPPLPAPTFRTGGSVTLRDGNG